jgi:hypothetical protein
MSMALVHADTFADEEVAMVYIAGRLSEGKRVERVLSEHAVDYIVDSEPFRSRILGIFPVEYEGVAFYVRADRAGLCRRALREAGLLEGLVEDDCG